jgi:hypothetical protein
MKMKPRARPTRIGTTALARKQAAFKVGRYRVGHHPFAVCILQLLRIIQMELANARIGGSAISAPAVPEVVPPPIQNGKP